MTPELEDYFDNYNSLFNHVGYAQLLEEIANKISSLSELSTISGADDLFFRKGQLDAFRTILAFQDTIGFAREQAEEDVQDI